MKKLLVPALTAGALLAAGAAHAGNVQWSIGINLPPVATVISSPPLPIPAPVIYAPEPVIYAPPPVIYRPAPRVIYAPAPVVYAPAPVVYRPVPVVYERWVPPGHRKWHHRRDWREDRGDWRGYRGGRDRDD